MFATATRQHNRTTTAQPCTHPHGLFCLQRPPVSEMARVGSGGDKCRATIVGFNIAFGPLTNYPILTGDICGPIARAVFTASSGLLRRGAWRTVKGGGSDRPKRIIVRRLLVVIAPSAGSPQCDNTCTRPICPSANG